MTDKDKTTLARYCDLLTKLPPEKKGELLHFMEGMAFMSSQQIMTHDSAPEQKPRT